MRGGKGIKGTAGFSFFTIKVSKGGNPPIIGG